MLGMVGETLSQLAVAESMLPSKLWQQIDAAYGLPYAELEHFRNETKRTAVRNETARTSVKPTKGILLLPLLLLLQLLYSFHYHTSRHYI